MTDPIEAAVACRECRNAHAAALLDESAAFDDSDTGSADRSSSSSPRVIKPLDDPYAPPSPWTGEGEDA